MKKTDKTVIEIGSGNIKLEFFFGRCFLSFDGVYLTKKFGLYSSVYAKKWYDSRLAIWHILEKKDNFLKIYGDWSYIPVRQTWEININNNQIIWRIKMEVIEEFHIELAQQNFMATDLYNNWEVPLFAGGKFPSFFSNYKGILWDRIFSMPQLKGEKLIISSSKANIPDLRLISNLSSDSHLLVIENSDPQYEARLLQSLFVNSNDNNIKPENYILFDVKIEVTPII